MRDESYMSTIFLISKYIDKYINISTVMYSGMKYNGENTFFFEKIREMASRWFTYYNYSFRFYVISIFFFAIVVVYMECVESFHTTNMVFKFISFHKPQQEDEQNFQATVTI